MMLLTSLLLGSTALAADDVGWQKTLDQVVPAVVALKVTATRDFDSEDASNSQGTGFIVDAEKGLILTNRHMVHAGPVVAEAIFADHEEIELQALYRDPVHDFGFYRFDPSKVKHMEVVDLDLAPDKARVGLDIRVVGNDSGEKMSILDGTLARLDRNAPNYGPTSYNDFNTFYIQAASNTSGGSSGSPVVDVDGDVVALNAGGKTRAASSFYLPLDRVVRALALLRDGQIEIPRGTLQATFRYTPFGELQRLGLPADTEADVRKTFPEGTGMLTVERLVPGGPADGRLEPGDIVLRVAGEAVTTFVPLEAALDAHVTKEIEIEVVRGGKVTPVTVGVQNLHAVSPSEYLEVGRAVLNNLSYQLARTHQVPALGAYVAVGGYMFNTAGIPESAVITHVDGEPVLNLDALQAELEKKADGQRLRVRFYTLGDPRHARETVAMMDRRWFPMRRCSRDDETGLWPCTESPDPPALQPDPPAQTLLTASAETAAGKAVGPSLVIVDFDVPYPTAGVKDLNYVGVGTVIDAEKGLVLVDRDTVPVPLGDMMLTFAGSVRVPGKVVYLHPVHNFGIIRYDPGLVGDLEVRSAELMPGLAEGDSVWQIGLSRAFELVELRTTAEAIEALGLGASRTPRFRDANVAGVLTGDASPSLGGVLADKKGRVKALWASFLDQAAGERTFYGLPVEFILPVLSDIREGRTPQYRALGAEVSPISLADARDRGVSDAWVRKLVAAQTGGLLALEVIRVTGGTPGGELLKEADIVVAIDGETVHDMKQIEALHDREKVMVTLFRDGRELEVEVPTALLPGGGVTRVVSWAGLLVHEPHYEVAAQQGIDPDGVYIAWLWFGSPAARYGLRPTRRILRIDGQAIHDLDGLLEVVTGMQDRQPVRVTLEGLDGSVQVKTLKLDLQYWPTAILALGDEGWERTEYR